MMLRTGYWILGVGLIIVGILLPRDWYDQLPKPDIPVGEQPIKGVTLLQICFVLDGIVLLGYGARRSSGNTEDAKRWLAPAGKDWMPAPRAGWALLLITLTGLGLRLYRLDSDLWLDEIAPLYAYGRMSAFHVMTSYTASNNHLLNTLLIKKAVALAGPQEWAIRLPAVLFGTATVPVLYWVARSALSRLASLGVALLLAVSYHHIFFSQNARGYSAYLFFSLLTSGLLLRGLQTDRRDLWLLYVVGMVLNFAANLLALVVFAAHVTVGALLVLKVRLAGSSARALGRRLVGVAAVTGLLGFHLYATVLPQAYVYIRAEYVKKVVGYAFFSREHAAELIRGVSAGFGIGGIVGMVLFLLVVGFGFIDLWRRHQTLALILVLPEVLTAGGLLLGGLQFTPRLFLLGLPLALLCLVSAVDRMAANVGRLLEVSEPKLTAAAVGIVCVVSLAALPIYYGRPKQDFRGAIRYVEEHRASGDLVLPLYLADWGYRFYGEHFGLVEHKDYFPARSLEALESVLRDHPGARTWAVMTFRRALRLSQPDLYTRIHDGWFPVRTFPGTIGDGDVSVWISKISPTNDAQTEIDRDRRPRMPTESMAPTVR
jgi:hypothetical protein